MATEAVFKTAVAPQDACLDVVFVHGLTGDPEDTWTDPGGSFWPCWFEQEFATVALHTLGFPASLFEKWAKKEMDMFERAGNVLERFAGLGIGHRPIAFVTHSLGGILTKMILRKSCEAEDEDWKRVSEVTQLVVFLSTPHTGAALASALNILPNASKHIQLLANETGFLEDLNNHYRGYANGKADLTTAVYYEKHATSRVAVVVSRESADPGVAGPEPVALDKDHINICKPQNRDDIVFLGIKRRLQRIVNEAHATDAGRLSTELDSYEKRNPSDRRDLLEKLIDADREVEYRYANDAQNRFARKYAKTGLFTTAQEDHDALLSEIEQRFITHIYHPLICHGADESSVRAALQSHVIDPLSGKSFGSVRCSPRTILDGLYFLTEQCYIQWDKPS